MKELTIEQQKKAIELLTEACDFIGVIKFEEGEEVDEDNIEGDIASFLVEISK